MVMCGKINIVVNLFKTSERLNEPHEISLVSIFFINAVLSRSITGRGSSASH